MYERPTGAPEPKLKAPPALPPHFDPFAPSGSYSYHQPNWFSPWQRISSFLLAVALLAYGAFGVYIDDFFIPGKRTSGVHLHGVSAWLVGAAILFAAATLLSLIVDHYDRRNNEHHYERFKKVARYASWSFFYGALLWHFTGLFRG